MRTLNITKRFFVVISLFTSVLFPAFCQQDDGNVLDWLVVYTAAARQNAFPTGTVAEQGEAMQRFILAREDEINTAFENSNVTGANGRLLQVRVVHMQEIDYVEAITQCAQLNGGTSCPGTAGTVHADHRRGDTDVGSLRTGNNGTEIVNDLKDIYKADITTLLIGTGFINSAGIGFQMGNRATFNLPFSVVRFDQAQINFSATHEIGHNLGCGHGINGAQQGIDAFSNGMGDAANDFHTIMSYTVTSNPCTLCPNNHINGACNWADICNGGANGHHTTRVPFFSSRDPLVTFNGDPVGNALSDNAETIHLSALAASRWRNSQAANITANHSALINTGATVFTITATNALNGSALLWVNGVYNHSAITGANQIVSLATSAPVSGYALLEISSPTQAPYRRTIAIGNSPNLNGSGVIVRGANGRVRAIYAVIEDAVNNALSNEIVEILPGTYTVASSAEINPDHLVNTGTQNVELWIPSGTIINVNASIYLNDNGSIHIAPGAHLLPQSIALVDAERRSTSEDPIRGIFHSIKRSLEVSQPRQTTKLGPGTYPISEIDCHDESIIGELGATRSECTIILCGTNSVANDIGMLWKNMIIENSTENSSFSFNSANANSEFSNLVFVNTASGFPRTKSGLATSITSGTLKITNCTFKNFEYGINVLTGIAPVIESSIFDGNNIGIGVLATSDLTGSNNNNYFNQNTSPIRKGTVDYLTATEVNSVTGGSNKFNNPNYVDEIARDFRLSTASLLIDAHSDGKTDIGPFQMDGYFEFADFLDGSITFSDGKVVTFSNGELTSGVDTDILFEKRYGVQYQSIISVVRKTKSINLTASITISCCAGARIPNLGANFVIVRGFMNNVPYANILFSSLPAAGATYTLPSATPDAVSPDQIPALVVSNSSSGKTLNWYPSSSMDVQAYKIYRSSQQIASVSGTSTTYTDTSSLTGNYSIVAYDPTGNQTLSTQGIIRQVISIGNGQLLNGGSGVQAIGSPFTTSIQTGDKVFVTADGEQYAIPVTQISDLWWAGTFALSYQGNGTANGDISIIRNDIPSTNHFICQGSCQNAIVLTNGVTSATLNTTGEVWYKVNKPINGWQVSEMDGRTISVNGTVVTSGQMPLPPSENEVYYFQFTPGSKSWTSWSFW